MGGEKLGIKALIPKVGYLFRAVILLVLGISKSYMSLMFFPPPEQS
jgi:hypothetical protein